MIIHKRTRTVRVNTSLHNGGKLKIGEKESDAKEEKRHTWLRREFAYSSYSQSFTIPDEVDESQITANMENGVLNITLPKKEQVIQEPVTRQIEIQ